ncbi:Cullin-associated NEDD8-dissociated protein 1 [Phlyctochytrium bullatum]|nr:Cullin-associated NEDD8-dissociated protein 1 [Phlyctochytrium bullatum]
MSAYVVANLLEKLNNADSDIRFMALADLNAELLRETNVFEDASERKIVAAIVKTLDDKNGEVQSQAVKLLGPLVKRIREPQLQDIVDQLCNLLTEKKEELRDISAIGLKTVIAEIPASNPITKNLIRRLIPKLNALLSKPSEVQLDTIDILAELLLRFGPVLSQDGGQAKDQDALLARKIQDTLLPLLNHMRPAIRKRTTVALGHLVVHTSDELFEELVSKIQVEMREKEQSEDFERLRTIIVAVSTLCPRRLGKHLDELMPSILKFCKLDDDELRENCLQTLTTVALDYIKYDPNYEDDDDDQENMEVDGDEGEDEGEDMEDDTADDEYDDGEDYSDDDDVSWKVRRSSAKLLSCIIGTRTERLPSLFADVAPVLISRFKEREESVRIEILSTFITLIRQVGAATRGQSIEDWKKSLSNIADPRTLLHQQVGRLSKSLSKQLSGKSVQTRQTGFVLLKELVIVLEGGLDARIALFVPAVETSLAKSATHDAKGLNNPNLKIDVLQFLQELFARHSPEVFQKYLARLVAPVISAANDKFYKITSEALLVVAHLVKVIRPLPEGASVDLEPPAVSKEADAHIKLIYSTVLDRLKTLDIDLEVKERSITALGTIVSQAGERLGKDEVKDVVVPLLIDRLRNELTRLTTLKVLKVITESPILGSFSGPEGLFPSSLASEIAAFLRKSQRQLRIAALSSLEVIIDKFGRHWPAPVLIEVLEELKPIVSEPDLNIFPLAIGVIGAILKVDQTGELATAIRAEVTPKIVLLILESPHLVVSGAGLESLLGYWKYILIKDDGKVFKESVDLLCSPIVKQTASGAQSKQVRKARNDSERSQAFRPLAQSIAALCIHCPAEAPALVSDFIGKIESSPDNVKLLALLVLGEIGRSTDVSKQSGTIHQVLFELFSSPSDEIKHAAAFSLGNISVGNLSFYLPFVFKAVREGGKRRYLVLVALKEIIARSAPSASAAKLLEPYSSELWTLLFTNAEEAQDEGTRTVIAECLGKLALSDPGKFLPDLQARLTSPIPTIRSTVVAAIRYTFTDAVSENFDALLAQLIVQFLRLVQDPDLLQNVRRVSLHTLNSAAHNKPYLITSSLEELLPLLYQETVVKEELIKIVEMGPFKHRVDDGLDARKSAYECMFTLLETCLSRIEVFGFLDRVISGLSDASQEIKTLCHVMLQRLAVLSPTALITRLDATISPLRETINSKPKNNAVKQEIEKLNDLVRSAVRTTLILSRVSRNPSGGSAAMSATSTVGSASLTADAGTLSKFEDFLRECRANGSPVADIFNSVQAEIDAQHAMGVGRATLGGLAPMDLS